MILLVIGFCLIQFLSFDVIATYEVGDTSERCILKLHINGIKMDPSRHHKNENRKDTTKAEEKKTSLEKH